MIESSLRPRPDGRKGQEERTAAYVDAALAGLVVEVAQAPGGGRNAALNRAAHRCGRLVAGGLLPLAGAEVVLLQAAEAAGLPAPEARATVRSGLQGGLRAGAAELPRELGELPRERPRPVLLASAPRTYPPAAKVAELWRRCGAVWTDPLRLDLEARGLDSAAIVDADLARALPPGALPRWARSRVGTWAESGHRLIVGLYDSAGDLRTVHARILRRGLAEGAVKGLSPIGYTTRGLVLADVAARALLRGERPAWWSGEVLLTEGVPSWLALACRWSDAAEPVPVIGYLQGGWVPELAQRIPQGAQVALWPHEDPAGERMAAEIAATLTHCRVMLLQERGTHGARC